MPIDSAWTGHSRTLTALLLAVVLPPAAMLVWLGVQLLQQDRVSLAQRELERRTAAAQAALNGPPRVTLASAEVGDARLLRLSDESVDAVLLLRPLDHLPEHDDRLRALAEATRICRRGGLVIAAAISRFASTLEGLRGSSLEDRSIAAMTADHRRNGQHRNPTANPVYFTTAYFHRPEELAKECVSVGLTHEAMVAVEGPGWLLPDLEARLADERCRSVLLEALAALEAEPTLLGMSAHLLAVARRC